MEKFTDSIIVSTKYRREHIELLIVVSRGVSSSSSRRDTDYNGNTYAGGGSLPLHVSKSIFMWPKELPHPCLVCVSSERRKSLPPVTQKSVSFLHLPMSLNTLLMTNNEKYLRILASYDAKNHNLAHHSHVVVQHRLISVNPFIPLLTYSPA